MISIQKIAGRVRGPDAGTYPENREDEQVQLGSLGHLVEAQSLSEQVEITRLGETWQCETQAYTGLTAVPTTAGLKTIWNGEPGNGKYLAIDSVHVTKVIIDVTTNDLATVWAQIIRPPMTAPTDAAFAIRSLSGRQNYGGRVRTVASSTTLANRWEAIGMVPNPTAAIAGSAWGTVEINCQGRFLIPPGAAFTITVSEVTATASTFRIGVRWHEIQVPVV